MKKIKLLAVLIAIIMTTNVNAALQSRPGVDGIEISVSEYFKLIREMEAEGGSFGLNATFAENATTGEYEETSISNNIDTHMCKNTEWGTVAMLSASDYGAGNGNVSYDYNNLTLTYGLKSSTTGNMSGIFGMYAGATSSEYVAAGIVSKMDSSYNKYLINAHPRYVDSYEDGTDNKDLSRYIPGDATYETRTFQDSTALRFVISRNPVFTRGGGGIFYAFYGDGSRRCYTDLGARLVVWVGEEI